MGTDKKLLAQKFKEGKVILFNKYNGYPNTLKRRVYGKLCRMTYKTPKEAKFYVIKSYKKILSSQKTLPSNTSYEIDCILNLLDTDPQFNILFEDLSKFIDILRRSHLLKNAQIKRNHKKI